MPLEPLFMVSDIPADIAMVVGAACGGTLCAAIGVLYKRQIVLEDRQQANIERAAASAFASAEALNKLTDTLRGQPRERT